MDDTTHESPDWEILKLLREVRRRVRAGDPRRFLDHLEDEPKWVAALPDAEAKVARTMLDATRELARRALQATPAEQEVFADAPRPVPGQAPEDELAVVTTSARRRGPRVLAVQTAVTLPKRRRSRAS